MQTFTLDLSNKRVVPLLYAKQKDTGAKIQIAITDNDKEYAIPAGTSFSVWYSGTSGAGNYVEINGKSAFSVSGNKVTVELIYQMLANPGEHLMCLVMSGTGGTRLGLWNIPYFVEGIPGENSQVAQQYYDAFVYAQQKAERAAQDAEAAAQRAEAAGYSGVYIGVEEPTNPNVNVWINPKGAGIPIYNGEVL